MNTDSAIITKDLIAQHNLTDDEFKKIVEILHEDSGETDHERPHCAT